MPDSAVIRMGRIVLPLDYWIAIKIDPIGNYRYQH